MARSCGIRIGPERFELVVLEGSSKRPKISSAHAGQFPPEAADFPNTPESILAVVDTLKDELKEHKVPRESVGLVIDTKLAAFRRVRLPFKDRSKIEQVLKFEVESQLPQWNIEDIVVDFVPLEETASGLEVLTTAVRKSDIKAYINACERAGFDPLEVELETSAMVNAASGADIFHEDDAQVLVHVGEHTTSVVVVDGGKVVDMRAIHIGASTNDPARAKEPSAQDGDQDGEQDDDGQVEVDPVEHQRRLDQAVRRIRREIGRTLSAARTEHEIDSIFVCGLELPGLVGDHILDHDVFVLDVFEEDSGQPADGVGQLVIAYGAALNQLGGGILKPQLRREEVRFSGTLERLELPVAVLSLLLIAFLAVQYIFVSKDLALVKESLGFWRDSSNLYMMGEPRKGHVGNLAYPSQKIRDYVAQLEPQMVDGRQVYQDDSQRNRFQQLTWIRKMLRDEVDELEKALGQNTDIGQPQSALKAMTLVMGVLNGSGGRPSLRAAESTYQVGKGGKKDTVRVELDLTFFADNTLEASQQFETFLRRLSEQPWYVEHQERSSKPIEGGEGISVAGLPITVDLAVEETQG